MSIGQGNLKDDDSENDGADVRSEDLAAALPDLISNPNDNDILFGRGKEQHLAWPVCTETLLFQAQVSSGGRET
jgi:hypothetical protein